MRCVVCRRSDGGEDEKFSFSGAGDEGTQWVLEAVGDGQLRVEMPSMEASVEVPPVTGTHWSGDITIPDIGTCRYELDILSATQGLHTVHFSADNCEVETVGIRIDEAKRQVIIADEDTTCIGTLNEACDTMSGCVRQNDEPEEGCFRLTRCEVLAMFAERVGVVHVTCGGAVAELTACILSKGVSLVSHEHD